MKQCILLFILSLGYLTSDAQAIPIYFKGDRVTANKDAATSYAVYGKLSDSDIWAFKRYDLYDNLLQTGFYKDDQLSKPHGIFTFYMDVDDFNDIYLTNFKLKGKYRFVSQKGEFVDGVEHGRWTLYFPDGNILNYQDFEHGKMHGEFVTYNRFGKVEIKGNYVNGEKEGIWILEGGDQTIVYQKGEIVARYNGNKPEKITAPFRGKFLQFGKPSSSIPNQQPNRKHEVYQEIEKFNSTHGTNFPSKTGEKYLSELGQIVNHLEEGVWTVFYPNGKVWYSATYVKGKATGEYLAYDLTGKLVTKGNYTDAVKVGQWLEEGKKVNYDKRKDSTKNK